MILGLQFYRNVTRDLTEIIYLRLNIGIMKTNEPIKMVILLIDIPIGSLQIAHEHIRCLVTVHIVRAVSGPEPRESSVPDLA